MSTSSSPDSEQNTSSSPQQDALRLKLEKAVRQRQDVEAKLIKAESELQTRTQSNAQLQEEVAQLKAQLAKAEQQAKKRQSAAKKEAAASSDAILHKEKQAWEVALVEKEERIATLQARLAEWETKQNQSLSAAESAALENVQAANQTLQARVTELEAQVAARQKLNERQRVDIESLQAQLEQQQLSLAQERRQWEQQQQEWQARLLEAQDLAQRRIDMLQRFKAELSLARTQIAESQQELSQLNSLHTSQQAAWQEQREHLEARLAGYAETEAETGQRWQEERQLYEEQIQSLKTQLQGIHSQYQQQLEQQHQEQQVLVQQLHQADERCRQLQQVQENLATQYDDAQKQVEELQQLTDNLQVRLQEYEDLLPDLLTAQDRLQDLEQQKQLLEATLAERSHELQSQFAFVAEKDAEMQLLRDKISEQQQHNLRLKAALERSINRGETPKEEDPHLPLPLAHYAAIGASAQVIAPVAASHRPVTSSRARKKKPIDLPNFLRSHV
jgi:chromosome segregation ATPase